MSKKKKIKEDQEEESYWEWVIASENGDTNMDLFSFQLSQALYQVLEIWNDTLGNVFTKED